MPVYEDKLNEFADDKRLIRLSRPVRDRGDAICDACGSTQPRTLYPLKDERTDRFYFVGNNCLKELVKRGVVLRRFGRDSGPSTYEREMRWRAEDREMDKTIEATCPEGDNRTTTETLVADTEAAPMQGPSQLFPTIIITQDTEYLQAFVCILSTPGTISFWGWAKEARYEEVWRRGGERGMLLEKVRQERQDALGLCVSRAWDDACSKLPDGDHSLLLLKATDGTLPGLSGLDALISVFKLIGTSDVVHPLCVCGSRRCRGMGRR